MKNPNYFMYCTTKGPVPKKLRSNECGIGRTSLSPGIHDAAWGTMYVVPYEYVWRGKHRHFGDMNDPELLSEIILSYFGH